MILNDILSHKRKDLAELKHRFPFRRLKKAVEHKAKVEQRSFLKAVSNTKRLNLICEIKKASPKF